MAISPISLNPLDILANVALGLINTSIPNSDSTPTSTSKRFTCPNCLNAKRKLPHLDHDRITHICRVCFDLKKKEMGITLGQICHRCNVVAKSWRLHPNNPNVWVCHLCASSILGSNKKIKKIY